MTAPATERGKARLMVRDIVRAASELAGEDIRSPSRRRKVARVRHAAFWVARNHTLASLHMIGRAFVRDHTTVLYGAACGDPVIAERLLCISRQYTERRAAINTALCCNVDNYPNNGASVEPQGAPT